MFKLSNIRKENRGEWTYLRCDFKVIGMENPFQEEEIFIAVESKNEDMLSEKVYDPFILVPLMLGMFYGQDLEIEGNISPRLYHNIKHYLISIFDNFSVHTKKINFTVKGFDIVEDSDIKLIGTGISCGVDSFTTIYDNYIKENNPDYKINSLFFNNSGTHGAYSETSRRLWLDRAKMNQQAAEELGLPLYLIDSNFHAFTRKFGQQKIGYLAIYSCALAVQKYVHRYLTASNFSYDEVAEFTIKSKDFDIAEYSETYMAHLISTEKFELVIDGCQYSRGEKVERIADWSIAKKYLNVCRSPIDHGKNCSDCYKCMWTLIPLEAIGKLDNFEKVFDLNKYRKKARKWKSIFLGEEDKKAMETIVIRHARKHNLKLPLLDEANEIYMLKEEVAIQRRELNRLKYKNSNIVIWGAGKTLEKNIDYISKGTNIKAVVDSDPLKWGKKIGKYICERPDNIKEIENLLVLISVKDEKVIREIREELEECGKEDIIHLSEWIEL